MKRLLVVPLAISFALPAGAAFAITSYDARTLGMGGSSVGYSGNASLAFWNPASVGMSRNTGVFLPSVAMSLSNNILSPNDAISLVQGFQGALNGTAASTDTSKLFTNLGSANGLTMQAEAFFEPIGVSLGKVGQGSMAFRLYGRALGSANMKLSSDFATNLNGLFFQGGFQELGNAINALNTSANGSAAATPAGREKLSQDVNNLKAALDKNMSSFIKRNGNYSKKTLDLTETVGANAAAAVTYAQPLAIKIPALPKAEISVGGTAKLFGSATSMIPNTTQTLLGGNGSEKVNMLGAGAQISLDIDKEVTELTDAITNFQQEQNIATTADLASKAGAFFSSGLNKSSVNFSSTTPDAVGAGLDLGAAMKIDDQWSVGLSLINPIMFWGATKSNYKYTVTNEGLRLVKDGADQKVNFWQAEPFVARAGAAWQPKWAGPPALTKGFLFNAGVEAPFGNGVPASVHLGMEKVFFDTIALRLGTQQLGLSPLYTAGLGIQTRFFQMNLGVGVDNPSTNVKGLAGALSIGAGF